MSKVCEVHNLRIKRNRKSRIDPEPQGTKFRSSQTESNEDSSKKGTEPMMILSSISNAPEEKPRIIDTNKKFEGSQSIEKEGSITLVDHDKKSHVFQIGEKIGEGGFGAVYKCKSSSGEIFALKKIATRLKGIPCLMEASILSTYNYPYLNRSLMINATLDGIYMLQDIAVSDLRTWRKNNNPTEDELRSIFYKVCLGIDFLHKRKIIHGDIKPSNILVYNMDDIRLTDFNLTTEVKWKSNIHICTSVYRPYEL